MPYLDEQGNTVDPKVYLDEGGNPIPPKEDEDPGFLSRVGKRLGEVPGRVAEVPGGIADIVRGTGALSKTPLGRDVDPGRALGGAGKVAGGLAALFEPVLAPAGEAARSGMRSYAEWLQSQGVEERPAGVAEGLPGKMIPVDPKAMASSAAFGAEMATPFMPFGKLLTGGAKIPGLLAKGVTPTGRTMIRELGMDAIRARHVHPSKALEFIDNVAAGSVGGAGICARHLRKSRMRLKAMAEDFASALGPHVEDPVILGSIFHGAVKGENTIVRTVGNAAFSNVDVIHGAPAVDLAGAYKVIKELQKEFPDVEGVSGFLKWAAQQTKPKTIPPDELAVFTAMFMGQGTPAAKIKPNVVSFLNANNAKATAHGFGGGVSPNAAQLDRAVAKFTTAIEDAIKVAGETVSPEAREALELAREFWKTEIHEVFNLNVVRQMLKNPNLAKEDIWSAFIKPGAITETRVFKKILGEEYWPYVQRAFVDDLFTRISKFDMASGSYPYDGKALVSQLHRWGDASLTEILGASKAKGLTDIAEMMATFQAKRGGMGFMAIQLMQASPILTTPGALLMGAPGVAVAAAQAPIYIFPPILAKILTNEKMTRFLVEGLQAGPGTVKGKRAAAALINFISNLPKGTTQKSKRPTKQSELERIFGVKKTYPEGAFE